MKTAGLTGRPLRAFTGLGLLLLLWITVRLPAMQHEMQALARLATAAAQPQPPDLAVPIKEVLPEVAVSTPPPLLALPAAVRVLLLVASQPAPPAVSPPLSAPLPPTAPASVPAASAPVNAPASVPPFDPAFTLATRAYDRLRVGQRRQAAALFDAALALQPDNGAWRADHAVLGRRWQLGGFALLRDGGPLPNQPGSGLPGLAASPVLGGGQLGNSIAFVTDPYARRPLALVARANVAADSQGVRRETAQLALGVRQTLLPGVSVSVWNG